MSSKKGRPATYREEIAIIEGCESLDPELAKAIKGLKLTIGSKKATDECLQDTIKAMRYSISAIDKLVFDGSITLKEFSKKYIRDENVNISMNNMIELRYNLANKKSEMEDYLANKKRAIYRQTMLDNGCTLSVKK